MPLLIPKCLLKINYECYRKSIIYNRECNIILNFITTCYLISLLDYEDSKLSQTLIQSLKNASRGSSEKMGARTLFAFFLPRTSHFMSNSADDSRKAEDAYPTGLLGPFSQFLVESKLLIYFCCFVCIILVALCSLLRLSVSHVSPLSIDYILLISARILVPLVTLRQFYT